MGKVREAMDSVSHPALLLVDGVSSIGALDFQFDKWGVDVAVTGSQKALSLPTGLTLVAASDKVRLYSTCKRRHIKMGAEHVIGIRLQVCEADSEPKYFPSCGPEYWY